MPPFPPKNDVLGCRGVTYLRVGGRAWMPGKSASPDILLRPFRGPPRRSGRWGRPGIAVRMEIHSWGREQCPPCASPIIPPPAPGARQSNHDGAGEMHSGLARLPFVRSPLLDERVCPLQKHVAMTRAGKDDIRSRCTAPEQQSEGALWQGEFVVQLQEMALRLFFRRPTEPAGVVVNHNTLALENQRLDFRTKDELGGPGLRVPQIGALDSVVGAYVDPQVEPPHPVFLGVLRWFTKRAPVCLTNAINARDTLVREVPKERVVATPNPELEVLQRELALVRQDSDGVRRDNEWLKSLAATRRGFNDPNNWTLVVTVVMLVLVGVYTQAAKEQVKAAHAQTESSVENMLRPVVVLAPHDDFRS